MENKAVAKLFRNVAHALEMEGENRFKILAYSKAADVIEELGQPIEDVARAEKLTDIEGIGKGISEKIGEFLKTGKVPQFEELFARWPAGVLEMAEIPGMGAKSSSKVYRELNIGNADELLAAIDSGELATVSGFGEKKCAKLRRSIEIYKEGRTRMNLGTASRIAAEVLALLEKTGLAQRLEIAGSLRRGRETIGDIDILAVSKKSKALIDALAELPGVEDILAKGESKGSVRFGGGRQIDLRVVDESEFGAALQYFTGSKSHNVKLRELALKQDCKLNEYGLFKGETKIAGAEEGGIYEKLGLAWIEPELREDRGEIEKAQTGKMPKLLQLSDIRGDFHMHTLWSDGANTIEEMALHCAKLGYEYMSISDHSQSLVIGNGLKPDRLKKQADEIDRVNEWIHDKGHKHFHLLKSSETDILSDGALDFDDATLDRLDFIIASLHSGFSQDEEQITTRLLRAMEHPKVKMIGHPTGRLILQRDPYKVNVEKLIAKSVESGVALEINANPKRLDLNDDYCRLGKEAGATFVINTDSHAVDQLGGMRFGVSVARRGWLEKKDILNAKSWKELAKCWGLKGK